MSWVDINGRFLTQATTGVQRYAREMVRAIDRLLQHDPELRDRQQFRLVTPRGAERTVAALDHIPRISRGRLSGQLWEQLELPLYTRHRLVLSLCNTAPLAARSVVTIHDAGVFAVPEAYSPAFRLWYRTLIPRLGTRAVQILTVSKFSRDELSSRGGVPLSKIEVIHPGCEHILEVPSDLGVFARLPVSPGSYLLAVGSRSTHKNLAAVIHAAAALGSAAPPIVTVGSGNTRIFNNPEGVSAPNVHSAGYATDAELRALYENAICLVYPSLYEGFGLPPLEAMVCGCPAIVSNTASLPEVCGNAVLYCDPEDPTNIARNITMMQNPCRREELRLAGLERAHRFTWRHASEGLLRTLERVQAL
jgi:glycosyltransferase involved in cell wall biosynthesis